MEKCRKSKIEQKLKYKSQLKNICRVRKHKVKKKLTVRDGKLP